MRAENQPGQYVWNVQCPTLPRGTKVIINAKNKPTTSLLTKDPDIENMSVQQKKNFSEAAINQGQKTEPSKTKIFEQMRAAGQLQKCEVFVPEAPESATGEVLG